MLVYGPTQKTLRLQQRYASSVLSLPKACVHVQENAASVSEIRNEVLAACICKQRMLRSVTCTAELHAKIDSSQTHKQSQLSLQQAQPVALAFVMYDSASPERQVHVSTYAETSYNSL